MNMLLNSDITCSRAEVAALARLLGGAALPAVGVLADGAVSPGLVPVAPAPSAGQGELGPLHSGAALHTSHNHTCKKVLSFLCRILLAAL